MVRHYGFTGHHASATRDRRRTGLIKLTASAYTGAVFHYPLFLSKRDCFSVLQLDTDTGRERNDDHPQKTFRTVLRPWRYARRRGTKERPACHRRAHRVGAAV